MRERQSLRRLKMCQVEELSSCGRWEMSGLCVREAAVAAPGEMLQVGFEKRSWNRDALR